MKKGSDNDVMNYCSNNATKQHQPCVNMLLPPPLILIVLCTLAAGLHWIKWGGFQFTLIRLFTGGSVILLSSLLIYLSGKTFLKYKTPIRPDKTHAVTIVMQGPYAFSRNPMYLGMVLIILGLSIMLKSPFFLFATFIFIVILEYGVIRKEERYLLQIHPDIYRIYRKKVRKWL